MSDLYIVALDLSLTSTGIATFYKGDCSTSVVTTKPLRDRYGNSPRIEEIVKAIQWKISLADEAPHVLIEDYAFAFKANSVTPLAELGGVVKFFLWKQQCQGKVRSLVTVSPSMIKNWITGKGTAKKEDVKLHAFKKFGKEFTTNDECDAYCLADLGWHLFNGKERRRLTQHENGILRKLALKIA